MEEDDPLLGGERRDCDYCKKSWRHQEQFTVSFPPSFTFAVPLSVAALFIVLKKVCFTKLKLS